MLFLRLCKDLNLSVPKLPRPDALQQTKRRKPPKKVDCELCGLTLSDKFVKRRHVSTTFWLFAVQIRIRSGTFTFWFWTEIYFELWNTGSLCSVASFSDIVFWLLVFLCFFWVFFYIFAWYATLFLPTEIKTAEL